MMKKYLVPLKNTVGILLICICLFCSACGSNSANETNDPSVANTVHKIYADSHKNSQNNSDKITKDTKLIALALNKKIINSFSYQDILSESKKTINNKVVGTNSNNLWQAYSSFINSVHQKLVDYYVKRLSDNEVRAYYDANKNNYKKHDTIEIQVETWFNNSFVSSENEVIEASNTKYFEEKNPEVYGVAINLQPGEQQSVSVNSSTQLLVRCINRTDGGYEPFEDVAQAVRTQAAQAKISEEINK